MNLYQRSVFMTWITRKNYIGQRPEICGSILGNFFSRARNLNSNVNSILPKDKWSDKETKLNIGIIFITLC